MRDVKKIRFGAVPGPRIKWERSIVRNAREMISTEEGAANCLETVERSCFRTMGWQSRSVIRAPWLLLDEEVKSGGILFIYYILFSMIMSQALNVNIGGSLCTL